MLQKALRTPCEDSVNCLEALGLGGSTSAGLFGDRISSDFPFLGSPTVQFRICSGNAIGVCVCASNVFMRCLGSRAQRPGKTPILSGIPLSPQALPTGKMSQ